MPLTKDQLEDIFWDATIMVLGLDPKAESTQKRVRKSWPDSKEGNSDWERDENVIFLQITTADDPYTIPWDISHEADDQGNLQEVVRYHKCHNIQWICYGPDSGEDADCIRIGILREPVRAFLRKSRLAVLTDIRQPKRIPEMDDAGQWWERNDLTAQCYELAERRYDEGEIAKPPKVTIFT